MYTYFITILTFISIHLLGLSQCNIEILDPQWNTVCPSLVLKIWVGYAPAGNHTTGTFVEREGINNIEGCIESCCEDESCNVVFMYKLTCYQISCYTNDLCAPVFNANVEKFGDNARMVFVRAIGNTEWPREIYDDGDTMLADSANLLESKACEIGIKIDCPTHETCTTVSKRSRAGVCQCNPGFTRNQSGNCVALNTELPKTNTTASVASLQTSVSGAPKSSSVAQPISSTPMPVKKLTVSVMSKETRLPESQVSISAYTVPAEGPGEQYNYEWKLLSQPTESTGAMQNAASSTLTLSHLSEGVYQFKVTVTGTHSAGEGFANVSVLPEMRLNQPPVAVVTPERQTIKLPNSEAVLDASSSHDDDGVSSYHWELTQGPLGYAPSLEDSPTLQLHNLSLPGNYSFRLTVKDKHGEISQAQAWVTVVKETDYPPEANAGQDVILYLPRNALTLNGNRSTDDRGIASWEWTKAPSDTNKAVDMQDTRTPYLKLSDLEAGVYTFVLKVIDTVNQSSTAEVHVFVKQPNHLPPTADAGPDRTIVLPVNWVILEAATTPPPSPQSPPVTDIKSTTTWLWSSVSGPAPVHFSALNLSRTNVTELTRGIYVFKLVVTDTADATSANDTVTITVLQNTNAPPKSNAGGDKTVSLPLTLLTLNGTKSSDDLAVVKYTWSWDGSSLAQGTILANSDTTPILMVSGVVPGQYVFKLKVEDEQGLTDEDTATIIVKPDPQLNSLARITLGAASRSLRRSQLTSLLRQLSLLLHGGATVTLRAVEEERNTGRAVVTFLAERQEQGAEKETLSGPIVVKTLRTKLKQDPNLLDLPVAHIETVICQNNCSGHGVCDEATRQCLCEAFWMQDLIGQYFRDGESNCDWSLLYVVVAATMLLLGLCGLSWAAYCMVSPACRHHTPHKSSTSRRPRRKASYSLLGSQEEEETNVGLGKSSRRLSLSDSDTDSDVLFETRSKVNGSMQMKSNGTSKQNGPKIGRRIKT